MAAALKRAGLVFQSLGCAAALHPALRGTWPGVAGCASRPARRCFTPSPPPESPAGDDIGSQGAAAVLGSPRVPAGGQNRGNGDAGGPHGGRVHPLPDGAEGGAGAPVGGHRQENGRPDHEDERPDHEGRCSLPVATQGGRLQRRRRRHCCPRHCRRRRP